jgi:hypothetical protein
MNALLINTLIGLLILESAQKVAELFTDEGVYLFAGNPLRDRTGCVWVVINIFEVVLVRLSFTISSEFVVTTVHHAHLLASKSGGIDLWVFVVRLECSWLTASSVQALLLSEAAVYFLTFVVIELLLLIIINTDTLVAVKGFNVLIVTENKQKVRQNSTINKSYLRFNVFIKVFSIIDFWGILLVVIIVKELLVFWLHGFIFSSSSKVADTGFSIFLVDIVTVKEIKVVRYILFHLPE